MGLNVFRALIDALIPPRKTELLIARLDLATLKRMRQPQYAAGIEALLPYDDPRIQALIWELKYYNSKISVNLFAGILSEALPSIVYETLSEKPLLIPLPLHAERKKARGYNQAERITNVVAKQVNGLVEHAPDILIRHKNTPRQTTLSRAKRLLNVKGAFKVEDRSRVYGRVCIVVDDVATTGSTLLSAGRALKSAGASSVILLALASAR